MHHRRALLALALSAALLAGCKREAEAPPAPVTDAVPVAPVEPTGTPAPAPMRAASAFDAQAFAGTYAGDLPCADCPGIDTTIAFTAEGGYAMSEVYRDDTGSSFTTKGSWTVGDDGKTLQLQPADKGERERWLEVASPTELRALDPVGKPIEGQPGFSLHRK